MGSLRILKRCEAAGVRAIARKIVAYAEAPPSYTVEVSVDNSLMYKCILYTEKDVLDVLDYQFRRFVAMSGAVYIGS